MASEALRRCRLRLGYQSCLGKHTPCASPLWRREASWRRSRVGELRRLPTSPATMELCGVAGLSRGRHACPGIADALKIP